MDDTVEFGSGFGSATSYGCVDYVVRDGDGLVVLVERRGGEQVGGESG